MPAPSGAALTLSQNKTKLMSSTTGLQAHPKKNPSKTTPERQNVDPKIFDSTGLTPKLVTPKGLPTDLTAFGLRFDHASSASSQVGQRRVVLQ
jgi:hypothetical protein